MSTSWVFRSVRISMVCTWVSYAAPDGGCPDTTRAGRLPRAGGPLHRDDRRGVLPPLRRPQGRARARADLRPLQRADLARDGEPRRLGGGRRPAYARALEVRLLRPPRRAHTRAGGEGGPGR